MRLLKILALSMIFFVTFLSGWAFMAGMGVERSLLDRSFYREVLVASEAVPQLHAGFHELLAQELLDVVPPDNQLDSQRLTQLVLRAIAEAFDEAWVEEQLLLVIDDMLALVRGEQAEATAVIDLREAKEKLETALATLMEEEAQVTGAFQQRDAAVMAAVLMREANLPDEIHVSDFGDGEEIPEEVASQFALLNTGRTYFLWLPYAFFGVLLFLCWALAGTAGGMKWLGTATALSGLTFLLGLRWLSGWSTSTLQELVAGAEPGAVDHQLGVEIFMTALTYTLEHLESVPVTFALVGLALVAGGFLLGHRKAPGVGDATRLSG